MANYLALANQFLTLTSGSVNFSITNMVVNNIINDLRAEDEIGCAGLRVPIATLTATGGTLAYPWPGANQNSNKWYVSRCANSRSDTLFAANQANNANSWQSRVIGQATPFYVLDILQSPPVAPVNGDRYLVDENPVLDFTGLTDHIVEYQNGKWIASAPRVGDFCNVTNTSLLLTFNGTDWYAANSGYFLSEEHDVLTGAFGIAKGTALLPSVFVSGDTNTGMWSPDSDQLAWSTGGVERLRIDNTGLVKAAGTVQARTFSAVSPANTAVEIQLNQTGQFDWRIKQRATTGELDFIQNGVSRLTLSSGGVVFPSTFGVSAGTVALPGFFFNGDPNTGFFSPGADQVGIATNGIQRLLATTTLVSSSLPFATPQGTVSSPAQPFLGDLDTGVYSPALDQWAVATAGVQRLLVTSAGITSTVNVDMPIGSVGSPSLFFTGDSNTGIYSPGADQWAVATNGQQRLLLTNTGATVTVPNYAPVGSAAAPTYSFVGETDVGMYSPAADQLGFSVVGVQRLNITTTAINPLLPVAAQLGSANAPTYSFTGDSNTGAFSPGADQWAVTTGGVQRLTVSTTAFTTSLPLYTPLGSVGAPSFSFTGDTDTGIYSPGANTVSLVTGGVEKIRLGTSPVVISPNVGLTAGNTQELFRVGDSRNGVSAGDGIRWIGIRDTTTVDSTQWTTQTIRMGRHVDSTEISSIDFGNYTLNLRTNGVNRLSIASGGAGSYAGNFSISGLTALGTTPGGARINALDVSFAPSTSSILNAAYRASGNFGGGYTMVDGTGYAATWMDNVGTFQRWGLGTASGVTTLMSLSNAGDLMLGSGANPAYRLHVRKDTQVDSYLQRNGATMVALPTTAPSIDGLLTSVYGSSTGSSEAVADFYLNGGTRSAANGIFRWFTSTSAGVGPKAVLDNNGLQVSGTIRANGVDLLNRIQQFALITDYGVSTSNTATANQNAIAAAEATGIAQFYWPPGNYPVNAMPTLGRHWGPGKPQISGVTTYIHPFPGNIEAIYPSAYGLDTTGNSDSTAKLQAAIDLAQSLDYALSFADIPFTRLQHGQLNVKHGRSASDTKRYHFVMDAACVTFYPNAAVGWNIEPRCTLADKGSGREIATILMINPRFDGYFFPTATAIRFGKAGFACENYNHSMITGIRVDSFTGTKTIEVIETRKLALNGALRGGQLDISAQASGSFCGDLELQNFEITGSTASKPGFVVRSLANTEVRGMRFEGCTLYGSGYTFQTTGTGRVGDIWMDKPQFDVGTTKERALNFDCPAGGQIFDVHMMNPYFVTYTAAVIRAVAGTAGGIINMNISNPQVGTVTTDNLTHNSVFYFEGVNGIHITNGMLSNITSGGSGSSLFRFVNCTDFHVWNTRERLSPGSKTNGVIVSGTASKYSFVGNDLSCTTFLNDSVNAASGISLFNNVGSGTAHTGWTAATGTASKGAYASAAAGTANATYLQSQIQGILDRLAAAEARIVAFDNALFQHGLIRA